MEAIRNGHLVKMTELMRIGTDQFNHVIDELKLVEAQYVGGRLGERLAELVVLLYGARNCFRAEFEKICDLEVSTDLDLGRSIGGDEIVRGEVEGLVRNLAEGQRDDDGE